MSVKMDVSQAVRGLNNLSSSLPRVGEQSQNEAAQSGVDGAKGRVHVISGDLRNSIRVFPRPSTGATMTARFGSDIRYAGIEEFRPGHSYLMPEYNRMQTYWPQLFITKLRTVF